MDLQEIIYNLLASTLDCKVYDYVPENAPFPYARITTSIDRVGGRTKTGKGMASKQYIDVFSSYKGKKELKQYMEQIVNLFDGKEYNGYYFTLQFTTSQEEEYRQFGENKGSIYHGVMIFNITKY